MSAVLLAGSVLAAGGEAKKSGPLGLVVILVLCVACYFLFKSMSKHLRTVREDFPDQLPPEPGRSTDLPGGGPAAGRDGEPGPAAGDGGPRDDGPGDRPGDGGSGDRPGDGGTAGDVAATRRNGEHPRA